MAITPFAWYTVGPNSLGHIGWTPSEPTTSLSAAVARLASAIECVIRIRIKELIEPLEDFWRLIECGYYEHNECPALLNIWQLFPESRPLITIEEGQTYEYDLASGPGYVPEMNIKLCM